MDELMLKQNSKPALYIFMSLRRRNRLQSLRPTLPLILPPPGRTPHTTNREQTHHQAHGSRRGILFQHQFIMSPQSNILLLCGMGL